MKEWVGDGKLITISMTVSSILSHLAGGTIVFTINVNKKNNTGHAAAMWAKATVTVATYIAQFMVV